VQAFASSQAKPLARGGLEHVPVAGAQVPTSWQTSLAVQVTGFDPAQVPLWHASVWVQASLSLQPVPSGAFGFEQAPLAGLQVPA